MKKFMKYTLAIAAMSMAAHQHSAQFDLPGLDDVPKIFGDDDKPANNAANNRGLNNAEKLLLEAAKPTVRGELEERLDTLATIDAWEAMADYDGPIATLMSILSPEGIEQVREEYMRGAAEKLSNKSTPKVSANATFDQFAEDLAWELKRVAAKSPFRLTLVIGEITAKDSADQAIVNEVLESLVENPSIADDYVIISVPREDATKIIDQIAGSVDEWKAPDGSNLNQFDKQTSHPQYTYVIDGALRQWSGENGQEFHSELVARIYHPHSQKMVGGKEIRQKDTFVYHPTHEWLTIEEDLELAKNSNGQPELTGVFKRAAPVARKLIVNEIVAKNSNQKEAGQVLIAADESTRLLAKEEYKSRLEKMPAETAWQQLSKKESKPSTLLSMIQQGGVEEERKRYARRARFNMLFQSTPKVSAGDVVERFADSVAKQMAAAHQQTGRKPVLMLCEVTSSDPQTQRMLYDIYAKLTKHQELGKTCVIVGLEPDRAEALIDELSGGTEKWTAKDFSNISEMQMQTFNVEDMYIVQGEFNQTLSEEGHIFSSAIVAKLLPANQLDAAQAKVTLTESSTHYFHPIHQWIPQGKETELLAAYDANEAEAPLPETLTQAFNNEAEAEPQPKPEKKKPRFSIPGF